MKHNIAFGYDIANAVHDEDWKLVAELIENNNGDIIGHDTKKDHISELLEHAVSSQAYAFVTELELIEINKQLIDSLTIKQ
jgi:hypothetical protein